MLLYKAVSWWEKEERGKIWSPIAINLFPKQKYLFLPCMIKNFTNGHKIIASFQNTLAVLHRNKVYHVSFFFLK